MADTSRSEKSSDANTAADKLAISFEKLETFRSPGNEEPMSLDLADSYHRLAQTFEKLRNVKRALDYYTNSYRIRKALIQYPHSDTAESLSCMGNCQEQLGELDKALDTQLAARGMREQIYDGAAHPDLVSSLATVARLYESLNDNDAALDMYKRALEMNLEIYTERNHPDTVELYQLIADIYERLGKYKESLEYFKRAAESKGDEEDDTKKAYTLFKMGHFLAKLSEHEQAIAHFNLALDLYKKSHAEESPNVPQADVANCLNHIGESYFKLGSMKKAFDNLSKAHKIRKDLYQSADDPGLLTSKVALAAYYDQVGDQAEAHRFKLDVYAIRKKMHSNVNHPELASAMSNLGISYQRLGNYSKALEFLQNAYDIRVQLYGENHVDVASSLFQLGLLHEQLGKLMDANDFYDSAYEKRKAIYKDEPHVELADSLTSLGHISSKFGDYKKAKDYHKRAYEMRLALSPNKISAELATDLYDLGSIFEKLGDSKASLDYFSQAYEMRKALMNDEQGDDQQKKLAINRLVRFQEKNQQAALPKKRNVNKERQSTYVVESSPPELVNLTTWGTKQVQRWFMENRIDRNIYKAFYLRNQLNGQGLIQLFEASPNANLFYRNVNQMTYGRASRDQIFLFIKCLKELMERDVTYAFKMGNKRSFEA